LNGVKIGDGKVGPMFKKTLSRWSSNVKVDIEEQIKSWKSDREMSSPTPYKFKNK
jgi:hypothetical protein